MFLGENFVWVDNPKTGSTSVTNCLLSHRLGETICSKHDNINTIVSRQYNRRWRMCAVRNPWDRMVSAFHHSSRHHYDNAEISGVDHVKKFEEWLVGDKWEVAPGLDVKRTPQSFWLYKVNAILRFETLEEDFTGQMHKMGYPGMFLPRDNMSKSRAPYYKYYNDRTREIVADRFRPDIIRWGYAF